MSFPYWIKSARCIQFHASLQPKVDIIKILDACRQEDMNMKLHQKKISAYKTQWKTPSVFPWESNTVFRQPAFHGTCRLISEKSITSLHPEPNNSSTHLPLYFFKIISPLSAHLCLGPQSYRLFPLCFLINILYAFLTPIYAMSPGQHIILDLIIIKKLKSTDLWCS